MDDDLGPRTTLPTNDEADAAESSEDEDAVDWTKVPTSQGGPRPIIPKRGEKEFEPAPGGGSSLQGYSLERSRRAMVGALESSRTISRKSVSYAVWVPGLARAQVFQARGVLFNSIGHAMRRRVDYAPGEAPRVVTNLELLPEEALYLIERGSMLCFKEDSKRPFLDLEKVQPESESFVESPMTVQHAFAEMIGREGLTLGRYQCYSYLKRLGFVVTRSTAPPDTPSYPIPSKKPASSNSPSLFRRFTTWIASLAPQWLHRTTRLHGFAPLWHGLDYASIFRSLRVIPAGHGRGLLSTAPKDSTPESPYRVFYNIWKPNTPWKKTAPPPPDFELVVVDGRTTPMPSLAELTDMFALLPTIPPPLPRRRNPPSTTTTAPPSSSPSTPTKLPSVLHYIICLGWLPDSLRSRLRPKSKTPAAPPLKPHPFAAIRAGHKNIIIGVADAGMVSFFRFGEGCFEEWPMA